MHVTEIVLFRTKPDCADEGLELARKVPQEAAKFGRMREHRTYRSTEDPCLLCHHIVWESMADFEKANAHFSDFPSGPRLMACMEPDMTMHHFELMSQGQGQQAEAVQKA